MLEIVPTLLGHQYEVAMSHRDLVPQLQNRLPFQLHRHVRSPDDLRDDHLNAVLFRDSPVQPYPNLQSY